MVHRQLNSCFFVPSQENTSCVGRILLFISVSTYLPDCSHQSLLKQYYINPNTSQGVGLRLRPECPYGYWITKPAIGICSSYVPITTHCEGSNFRGGALRLNKGFKVLPGIVYCNRYGSCNQMFCLFQAWRVFVYRNFIFGTQINRIHSKYSQTEKVNIVLAEVCFLSLKQHLSVWLK